MLAAMMGMIIFGAIFIIPPWLKVVGEGPMAPRNAPRLDVGAVRRRVAAGHVRDARRVHGRGKSRGNNAHHAGLSRYA